MRVLSWPTPTRPAGGRACLRAARGWLARADVILHAGDVCTPEVLDDPAAFAPVHVVLGNNDGPAVAAWARPRRWS